MFEATTDVLLLDYFRVPYRIVERPDSIPASLDGVWPEGGTGLVLWPRWSDAAPKPASLRLAEIPLFARVLSHERAPALPGGETADWRPHQNVVSSDGHVVAHVLADTVSRSIFFPFDPAEAITAYWSEGYQAQERATIGGHVKRTALRAYYRARPIVPRRAQIALRRRLARIQARRTFPRWPLETALHDLYDVLMSALANVAGAPVPHLAPWPRPYRWALVLTHDVERRPGYEAISRLAETETAAGFRSSWNLVPERDYVVDDALVDDLRRNGFEIGVHGLRHDGRDLESDDELRRRLPAIRSYAERWGAVGFRSPATHRAWRLMPQLGFDYDSSYPDTDPFEPQAGGCCSWWPFFNGSLIELPITLVQDHTAFVILNRRDGTLWREKADILSRRGGMALMITHPDYMLEPELVAVYRGFLESYADDQTLWRALPRDVAEWWRRRAQTSIELFAGSWRPVGPGADEAQVEFHGTPSP